MKKTLDVFHLNLGLVWLLPLEVWNLDPEKHLLVSRTPPENPPEIHLSGLCSST